MSVCERIIEFLFIYITINYFFFFQFSFILSGQFKKLLAAEKFTRGSTIVYSDHPGWNSLRSARLLADHGRRILWKRLLKIWETYSRIYLSRVNARCTHERAPVIISDRERERRGFFGMQHTFTFINSCLNPRFILHGWIPSGGSKIISIVSLSELASFHLRHVESR